MVMLLRGGASIARLTAWLAMVLLTVCCMFVPAPAQASDAKPQNNGAQILEAFDLQQQQRVNGDGLSDHKKHVIVFLIGVPLIILLLVTGGLGIAMGVYGKQQLFLSHMICAGLTMTLAVVHVVVTLVWFFPF